MNCLFCNSECGEKKYCNDKCDQKYHNSLKVGVNNCICGKSIYIDSTYCKSCMPKYLKKKDRNVEYNCENCGRKYKLADKRNGATTTKCASCQVNIRKYTNKIKAIEYKGGCCELCGYSKCVRALCFHHKDPNKKEFGISGNHCRKWEKVKEELDKCLLLCHNCHMEIHDTLEGVITSNQKSTRVVSSHQTTVICR